MKKKYLFKKAAAAVLSGVMLMTVIGGCGKSASEDNKGKNGAATKDGGKISIMIGQDHNTPGLQQMFEKLENEEGIKVDIQVVEADQYLNLVQMKKASGELPDLFCYNVPQIYNVFDPESDLYDFSNEPWVENLVDPDGFRYNGKLFAFPIKSSSGYQSMIYNKDVFDKYGLDIPETPEEFDALCQNLKDNGVTPILVASDIWVPQIWMTAGYARAMETEEAAAEMTETIINGEKKFSDYPQLVEVIDYFLSLNEKGFMNDDVATLSWDEAWVEMADGEGAMLMGEGPMIGQQQSMFPDTTFGVFNLPAPYDTQDILSGSNYSTCFGCSKDNQNIETVEKVLEKFSTPEYLNLYFEDAPGFPAFKGADGGEMQEDVRAMYEEHQQDGKIAPEMNLSWGAFEPVFYDHLWAYYLEALAKGNTDGKQLLDRFQGDVDKYLRESSK